MHLAYVKQARWAPLAGQQVRYLISKHAHGGGGIKAKHAFWGLVELNASKYQFDGTCEMNAAYFYTI